MEDDRRWSHQSHVSVLLCGAPPLLGSQLHLDLIAHLVLPQRHVLVPLPPPVLVSLCDRDMYNLLFE